MKLENSRSGKSDVHVNGEHGRERWHRLTMMGIDVVLIVVSFYLALAVGGHEIAAIN